MRKLIILTKSHSLLVLIFLLLSQVIVAQQDSIRQNTDTIQIQALRVESNISKSPFSVSKVDFENSSYLYSGLSLQDQLLNSAGIYTSNAQNFAQDLRISIRGFGARSAFGIRGVKLVVDGIPETTPDGQGQLDNLDISAIQQIELVKGPASTFYGNASGGVIHIKTAEPKPGNSIAIDLLNGSFGLQKYSLTGNWLKNKSAVIFHVNHIQIDGFRDHSNYENTQASLKYYYTFTPKLKTRFLVQYSNSPVALDPGGITIQQVESDRSSARDRNISFEAGEQVEHQTLSNRTEYTFSKSTSLLSSSFISQRNFEGRLPFEFGGWIDLRRRYFGNTTSLNHKSIMQNAVNTIQFGVEYNNQRDKRKRFLNLEGNQGEQTIDQNEKFSSLSSFFLNQYEWNTILVFAGLRYDINFLSVDDFFLTNGDASDNIILKAFNPTIGVNFNVYRHLHMYANLRTGFETPTLSELSADPDGGGGFNSDLKSQSSVNLEFGTKGKFGSSDRFDASIYYVKSENELLPFELADFGGRTFYRNAGSTFRFGYDLEYQIRWKSFLLTSYLSYLEAKYDKFTVNQTDFSGLHLPGIPKYRTGLGISYAAEDNLTIALNYNYRSIVFVRDDNLLTDNAFHLVNFKIGYQYNFDNIQLHPYFGLNNVFDAHFNDNIRLNAFGERYYEPAAGRNIYTGLKILFH